MVVHHLYWENLYHLNPQWLEKNKDVSIKIPRCNAAKPRNPVSAKVSTLPSFNCWACEALFDSVSDAWGT